MTGHRPSPADRADWRRIVDDQADTTGINPAPVVPAQKKVS